MKRDFTFSIIGVGRFGFFWGKQISDYFPVRFFDVDEKNKREAEDYGNWCSLETCLQSDYIFLTIPIRQIEIFLRENAHRIKSGSVVIDCASVKMNVVRWLEKYLPEDVHFAASHPLFGPDSAKYNLRNHTITLQPGKIPYDRYKVLVDLFTKEMGLKTLNVSAKAHDKMMAYNLSLIHHLGRTFHRMQIARLPLIMANLERMNHISRIAANDTEELFQDFYRFNPFAETVRDDFLKNFDAITDDFLVPVLE